MKREFRESNLVSEKIDPLKVLFFSFLSFVCPRIGVANCFCKFWTREENEFAFFSQKIVRRKTEREERRAEERLLMMKRERTEEEKKREFVTTICVSHIFSFEEECRYTTNNK